MNINRQKIILAIKILFIYIPAALTYYGFFSLLSDTETMDLGGGYIYFDGNESINGKNLNIPGLVENFEFNDRFIIARQNPNGSFPSAYDPKGNHTYPLGNWQLHYWILDKFEDRYYGPLPPAKYFELRDSLNIKLTFGKYKRY